MKHKVIFHIDIDSFFVDSELTLRPELINEDIAISNGSNNSIVSSLSYSAKRKGAKVPMKLKDVKKKCPDIITLTPNFSLYTNISNKIYNFLISQYTNLIEIGSIDEWFMDASDIWKKYGNIFNLAKDIQKKIQSYFKLNASIGISYNKFLAKMSTDINKPFGITITKKEDIEKNIWNLDISKYWGIGITLQKELQKNKINTIGDLAKIKKNDPKFKYIFKNQINKYVDQANGIGDDKINLLSVNLTSINNSLTFSNGFKNDILSINNLIKEISFLVEKRLKERCLQGNKISILIKKAKHDISSLTTSLPFAINNFEQIYENAIFLFYKLWDGEYISGIGIKVFSLSNIYELQTEKNLFEKNSKKIVNKTQTIILELNNKMNKKVFYSAKELINNKTIKSIQSKYLK